MSSDRLKTLFKFLEEDPNDSFTRYAIALEYASMNNLDEAITRLSDLIKHDPNYVPAYQQLGSFFSRAGKHNEAKAALESGIRIAGKVGDTHALSEMQEALDELHEN